MSGDWRAQLAPERVPSPPSWWPPAFGWWCLAAVVLALVAGFFLWRRYSAGARRRRVRAAALVELERIRALTDARAASALQRLMRRYALTVYGAPAIGSLTGESWLRFVQAHGGDALGGERGELFLKAAFGAGSHALQPEWVAGAEGFIRHRLREGDLS